MVAPVFNNSEPLTVDEIERLPRWAAVALAARCAMRIAPITGLSGKFHFWRTEAASNANAIELVPYLVAFSSVSGTDQSLHLVKSIVARAGEKAEAANAMAEAAAVAACSRAAAASIAASGKGAAVTRAATAAAVRATDVRAATAAREGMAQVPGIDRRVAAAAARAIQAATKADCQLLSKLIAASTDENWCVPLDFYETPLWPQGNLPEGWNQLLALWEDALTHLSHKDIYERHVAAASGGPIAWDDMEKRLQDWVDSLAQSPPESEPQYGKPVPSDDLEDEIENDDFETPVSKEKTGEQNPSSETAEKKTLTPGPAETVSSGPALPLSDRVAQSDVLDRENLIAAVGAIMASPRQDSPFTLGLFGDWGSGKSSVLEQVKNRLSQHPYQNQFDFAVFNPWINRHSKSIQAEIVKSVVSGLTQKVDRKSRLKLMWDFIRQEPKQMIYKGLIGLCFYLVASLALGIIALALNNTIVHAVYGTTFLTGLGLFTWRFWKQLQPAFEQTLPFPVSLKVDLPEKDEPQSVSSAEWKSQLQTLCNLRFQTKNPNQPRRLVLLIDDIDRCPTHVILETLNSVQLIADLPGVMTIVATDERVALQAVADQFRDVEDEERSSGTLARDYLGKLFQASIALNTPSRATIRKFVEKWLFPDVSDSSRKASQRDAIVAPHQDLSTQLTTPAAAAADSIYNKLVEDPALPVDSGNITIEQVLQIDMRDTNRDKAMFIDLADLFNITNPRQLIRLRNSYRLAKAFNRIRRYDENLKEFGLSKIMTLLFWEEFLRTSSSDTRKLAKRAIYTNDAIDREHFASSIVDGINRIRDVFDLSMNDEESVKRTQFRELNDFVNQFLLPYVLKSDKSKSAAQQMTDNRDDEENNVDNDDHDSSQDNVQRAVRLMTR